MCTGWGLVDRNFGLVDLVNKALGLVNKPKWHFEMACILLMIVRYPKPPQLSSAGLAIHRTHPNGAYARRTPL